VDSTGKVLEDFDLKPNAQNNPQMGLVANPDTKHYWNRDIFTHITYESSLEKVEDFKDYKLDTVRQNQSFLTASGTKMLVFDSIVSHKSKKSDEYMVQAYVRAILLSDTFSLSPSFVINANGENSRINFADDVNSPAGVLLRLNGIIPATNQFIFTSAERKPQMDYVVMTAIEFPFIRLVWAGTVLMVLGFFIALRNRMRQVRNSRKDED
jgi:cytochrome c-type biogenesis protein CcmF